eukprot:3448459-Rhodomonas_salina.1
MVAQRGDAHLEFCADDGVEELLQCEVAVFCRRMPHYWLLLCLARTAVSAPSIVHHARKTKAQKSGAHLRENDVGFNGGDLFRGEHSWKHNTLCQHWPWCSRRMGRWVSKPSFRSLRELTACAHSYWVGLRSPSDMKFDCRREGKTMNRNAAKIAMRSKKKEHSLLDKETRSLSLPFPLEFSFSGIRSSVSPSAVLRSFCMHVRDDASGICVDEIVHDDGAEGCDHGNTLNQASRNKG